MIPFISQFLQAAAVQAQLALPPVVEPAGTPNALLTFICEFIFRWLFTAAIILAIIFALIAAFKYLTSSGEPAKIQSANRTLIFVAIGVAVALLARSVPVLVGSFVAGQVNLDPCPAGSTQQPPQTGQ